MRQRYAIEDREHPIYERKRAMTEFERFQMQRAKDAEVWMNSAEYRKEEKENRILREALDRKYGHSPLCGILKCHPSCKRKA